MLDRESILRRGGELELECPDLGSDLMGNNGESKLSYYKHGSVGVRSDSGAYASARHTALHRQATESSLSRLVRFFQAAKQPTSRISPNTVLYATNQPAEPVVSAKKQVIDSNVMVIGNEHNALLRQQLAWHPPCSATAGCCVPFEMQPPEVTIITEQPAISAESLMQTSITTSLASVIATALSNGEMVHIEFTPTADGGISATIDGGTTPLVLPDEPTINPTQGVDNEPDRLRDAAVYLQFLIDTAQEPEPMQPPQAHSACDNPMAQWCAAFADSDSTVDFDGEMVASGPLAVDLATCTGTTEEGGEKEGGGIPGLVSAPDASAGIKMGGVDAELPLQFKLPNSVRGKKKWHNCASIIGTAYLSKPLRQQFARQRQAATIMAAAIRRMRAKGRFWTAKSNDRALLGTFQTWLSAGKLQSAVYSAISAATATTLAKSNGSSLVRAFTTWQRQSRSRWIVPAACTSYFVRRRALAAWATCCYSKARPAKQKTAQRYIVLAKDYLAIIKQHQVPEPIMSGETGQPQLMSPMMMPPMVKPPVMMQDVALPPYHQPMMTFGTPMLQPGLEPSGSPRGPDGYYTYGHSEHYGSPRGNDAYISIGRYGLDASPADMDDEQFTWSTRADAARAGELDFIGIGDEYAAPDPAGLGLDSYVYGYERDGYHMEYGYGTEASRPPDYDDPEDERAYPNGVIYEDDPDFPSFEDDYDDGYEEGYEGGYEGYA